jgi:hypothetical protein
VNDRVRRPGLAGLGLVAALTLASPAGAQSSDASTANQSTLGTTFEAEVLRDLPASDNLFAVIESIQPSIISDRFSNGGLFAAQPARLGGFLGSFTQTLFRVGDVDVTDANGSGMPLLIPDLMIWQRVDVTTGMSTDDVNTAGMAVTLEPRRPGSAWTRTIQIGASHGGLISSSASSVAAPIAQLEAWDRASLTMGGPLIANRLGVVLAASWTRGSQFARGGSDALQQSVATTFGHLVFTPNDRHEIRLLGWVDRTKTPPAMDGPFNQPDASTTDLAGHIQAVWERRAPDRMPWRIFAGYTQRDREVNLPASTAVFERLVDGPASGLSSLSSATSSQWTIGARVTPSRQLAGRPHAFHLGVQARGARSEATSFFSGILGELVDGHPARIWSVSNPGIDSIRQQIGVAAYVSDRVALTSRISAEIGLRFDSVSGSATGAENDIQWRSLLPRAAIRWSITDAWHTAAFASFVRSGYRLPLNMLAIGDPAAPTSDVFRWDTTSTSPPLNARGPLVMRTGPGTRGDAAFSRIDPDLQQPIADELAIGLDVWPSENLHLRLAGTSRREDTLIGLVNVGVPSSGYSSFSVQDPGSNVLDPGDDRAVTVYNRLPSSFGADRYLLTNPEQEAATLRGIELSAALKRGRLVMFAGATAIEAVAQAASPGFGVLENDQSEIGELFADPNAATFARGRPFNDRGYTIKIAGTFQLPAAIRLGAIARYQDGQPFARMLVFPQLNQGATAVRAFANGDSRFPFIATLDLRLQKGFTIGMSRLGAILDVYNLLNSSYGVEERAAAAPDVRTATVVQPPRAIHVGLRFDF